MRFVLIVLIAFLLCPTIALATPSDAYWVGAELNLLDVPPKAPMVFYQGNINFDAAKKISKFDSKGIRPKPLKDRDITLMFKVFGALPDPNFILRTYAHRNTRWTKYKANVQGIQLDYDATPAELQDYTTYLADLRTTLVNTPISITAPVDWLVKAEPTDLLLLSGTTQEIVFKLYQGTSPLPQLESYPAQFQDLEFPFKIGMIIGWDTPELIAAFAKNPNFKGMVYYPGIAKDE